MYKIGSGCQEACSPFWGSRGQSLGKTAHTCNPVTQKIEAGFQELKAILGYI